MLEKLSEKVLRDEYFLRLFKKAEKISAYNFFQIETSCSHTEKEFIDLLRFADILSHSKDPKAKNLSYKVISLLVDEKKDDHLFKIFATAILSKLGNFPALQFLSDNFHHQEKLPFERELEKKLKEEVQKVPYDNKNNKIFTDSQFEIFEALKNNNHFSFSGPTSLGKSFIIESFVRYLVSKDGSKENIVILVPTRALINQVSFKLKKDLEHIENYKILTHPIVPEIFRRDSGKYVFVFTPERLIAYLSDPNNPKIEILFIDEAQKIISEKDTRSPLYYHAILQAERKSIKLFFSSPNIPNPEIFLHIFEKSTDEKISIKESPVSQNRYFIDLVENRALFFPENSKEISLPINGTNNQDFFYWLGKLGSKDKNIIYCNTIEDTINYTLYFSDKLPEKKHPKINELVEMIEKYLHKKYYLIDCLKKGVAFHFGKLPQRIRVKIEELFREKVIDCMFCTSTLLEGVNLPAKNIFILSNAIGLSKFTDIDFLNLAGRAGRLTKDLSGNIICIRAKVKKNRWDKPEKDLEIVKKQDVAPIEPLIIKGQKNFFKNLENSLLQEKFTRENASQNEKDIWNYFANIALIHEIRRDESVLRSSFIEKNPSARELLKKVSKSIKIPDKILAASSSIKARYQNKIFDNLTQHDILPNDVDYETALKYLNVLYEKYNWIEEESGGNNPLIKKEEEVLTYYAMLMNAWINSDPISKIIMTTIGFHKNKTIWVIDQKEFFDSKKKKHINVIINNLIGDIDNVLRFKLEKYFNNYYLLIKEKYGKKKAGANWAEYLEYGTTNKEIIELQNIGFSRHLAKYILDTHSDCLKFENSILEHLDDKKLENDFNKDSDEYHEYKEIAW